MVLYFEAVGLSEPSMANVAFIWLFAGVDSQVPLQLESIRTGVGTVWALVGPFARVASHVALELAQFNRSIIALCTTVRFFVCVAIAHMANQLSRSRKRTVTMLAAMRFSARMRVDVILQGGQCFETTITHTALVRTLL